ncbi:MAG: response regulator [Bacteroidetes bacterium]|jgi:CheY-like chemotaxis protein|nr:response regulator [Bacteroidota bacterium]MBP6427088.1 response regulator [Bacteroidia bacterium]MBP6656278.1 response regulator [Bacteroidia bacterium]
MENMSACYKRVMIIDDTYVDRYIAERNLLKYEFAEEVIVKESADEALAYLKSIGQNDELIPELIFLDIRMPDIDGFGFLKEYETLSPYIKSHCIIIMLSTSLNPEDHNLAASSPYVREFINKPLDRTKIEELRNAFDIVKTGS